MPGGSRARKPRLSQTAHLADSDTGDRSRQVGEADIDPTGHQSRHRGTASLVRHMHDVELRHRLEEFEREVGRVAETGRAALQAALVNARQIQQLRGVADLQVGPCDEQHRREPDRARSGEVGADVIGQGTPERWRERRRAVGGQHEGGAIGRGAGGEARGHLTAGLVVDHDGAAQPFADPGRNQPCQGIAGAAGWEAHDEAKRRVGKDR